MDSFLSLFDPGPSKVTSGSTSKRKATSCPSTPSAENGYQVVHRRGSPLVPLEQETSSDSENLPPEPEQGNVEYKLKLINPTSSRFEHLVTQMKWRLREGQGEAIYEIGVEDSGVRKGLCRAEMFSTLSTLDQMAERLGATTMVLRELVMSNGNLVKTVLVRKIPDDQQMLQITVAVMGNENAGKSTLLGVLIQGELDDGRGKARLNMLRHLHEIESGRTSSINHELLGFDSNGNAINYSEGTPETICELSSKLVTLIDLAGHRKYLKTTIKGVTGYSPHYLIFVISTSTGFTKMTHEHLILALALQIPLIVVLTKGDISSTAQTKQLIVQLSDCLGTFNKRLVRLRTINDIITASAKQPNESEVPVISVSSVSGVGIDLLKNLLFLLPSRLNSSECQRLEQEPLEFQIDETFRIPEVGVVLGGLLTQGILTEGTQALLGPFGDGSFKPVSVKSIRRHKICQRSVKASQSASLTLDVSIEARPGMVLISPFTETTSCFYFQATIIVLYHATVIRKGFQMTVHIGNIRQTAAVHLIHPSTPTLSTNDEATVVFRFMTRPEYLKVGSRLLFREGQTKGFGTVTKLFQTQPENEDNFLEEVIPCSVGLSS